MRRRRGHRYTSDPSFAPCFRGYSAPMQSSRCIERIRGSSDRAPLAAAHRAGQRGARGARRRRHAAGASSRSVPRAELEARFEPRERVSRPDHVLLPGFVNAHTRASMSLLRGLPVYAPLMRWMRETVAPAELRCVSPDFVRDGTQLAIAEMLRAGITTFADSDLFPGRSGARRGRGARARGHRPACIGNGQRLGRRRHGAFRARGAAVGRVQIEPVGFAVFRAAAVLRHRATRCSRICAAWRTSSTRASPCRVHETEVEVRDTLSQHGCRPLRAAGGSRPAAARVSPRST